MSLKIIAHRGIFDNKTIPENSIASFKKALKLKYPIEFDVQLTKDNKLIIFHDENTLRMTGKNINIQESNYSDLKKLFLLDSKESIPIFKDILNLIDNKVFLDIEIKNTKRIKDTCDLLVNELDKYKNYSLKSFNPFIVKYIRKKYPNIKCGLLLSNKYNKKIYNLCKTKLMIKYSSANFLSIHKDLLSKNKYIKLSKIYPLQIWTIKEKKEVDYTNNIEYICNNLPY